MSLYSSCTSAASSAGSSVSSTTKPSEIDGLLAGAGYRVRSSDLRHVAQHLERLDAAMVNSPAEVSQLASKVVHYNPSDIASWVDSLLSEFNQTASLPSDLPELPELVVGPVLNQMVLAEDAWTDHDAPQHQQLNNWFPVMTALEEN